ncbi:MAG: KTSC domain-containing protein [Planctomycetales bacterium]
MSVPRECEGQRRILLRRLLPALALLSLVSCTDATRPDAGRANHDPRSATIPAGSAEREIERTAVSSSAMRSVGYDPAAAVLEIEFANGDVYRYFDVPPPVHAGLMRASSHGRYFNQHIRNADYEYVRVSE